MKKVLLKTNIKREQFLYYCGTSKDGFLTVCSTELSRGNTRKKRKPTQKKEKKAKVFKE